MEIQENEKFEKWCCENTIDEIEILTNISKKQSIKWLVLSLIPIVNLFTIGKLIFCYNNIYYMKSRGNNTGNNFFRWLLLFWGLIIIPLLEINYLERHKEKAIKILGWEKIALD